MESTQAKNDEELVFVAVPTYGNVVTGTVMSLLNVGAGLKVIPGLRCSSNLAHCFNWLWCECLNLKRRGANISRFVMLHSDCIAEAGFARKLLDEQRRTGADVVSAVIPIKDQDDSGITSTAFLDPKTGEMRRLTQRELFALPRPTFDAVGAGFPGRILLINTGCWIADLRKHPWREWTREGKVLFEIRNQITEDESGDLKAQTFTEDWNFGLQLSKLPVKVMATKAITIKHQGPKDWLNQGNWGKWEHDLQPDLYQDELIGQQVKTNGLAVASGR